MTGFSRHIALLAALLLFACVVATPAGAATTHVVKKGETLSSIAERYGIATRELARANKLRDIDLVRTGQKLFIPGRAASFVDHKVRKGESLATIAKRYRVSVADIRAYNSLKDPNHIVTGQVLRIPQPAAAGSMPSPSTASPAPAPAAAAATASLPAAVQSAISTAKVSPGRWKHIVIHHSGTKEGSGKGMDRYHRDERHMENGLAYHFVIGNGHGMKDGEIYLGKRWKEQLDGGHLAIPELNANSIGICLVGDFEKTQPTRHQMNALEALVRALMKRAGVPAKQVTTHRLIHPKHTQCPGRKFPLESFKKSLAKP